jgi:hypothetical protein
MMSVLSWTLSLIMDEGEASQSMLLCQRTNQLKVLHLDLENQAKKALLLFQQVVPLLFQQVVPHFFHESKDVGGCSSGLSKSQIAKLQRSCCGAQAPGIPKSFRKLINNSLMMSNPKVFIVVCKTFERSISWITNLASRFLNQSGM